MTYELLDHPADVKIRTQGATLEDAFAEVVAAVAAVVGEVGSETREAVPLAVDLRAPSAEPLLFDFLNELILFQDLEDVVVTRADGLSIERDAEGYRLTASIRARPIPPDRPRLDLKAPTYSEMRIEQGDGWTIEAVLDV